MQGFMVTLLACSAAMSALALFYMAVTPLLARRYSVKGCYYAWLVIVIGLIIPFRPQFDNAMVKAAIPVHTAASVIRTGNGIADAVPLEGASVSALSGIPWWRVAAAVWLLGMLLFFVYHGIRHYRFLKLTARWSGNVTDEEPLALLESLKIQMGMSQNIGLQVCASIGSPMLTGFVRPRILLPKADFAKEELCFILRHELVHCRRKDLWYKCLVLTAAAVHWFNPVVYLMAKAINLACELSCDGEVIRGADSDTRRYYGEMIIGAARYQSKLKTALSTNFYGGRRGMKERIFSIMDMSRKKSGLIIFGGALALTLGTGAVFTANAGTQDSLESVEENGNKYVTAVPVVSFDCKMLPDPGLYSQYSDYGIAVSDDGKTLLYNGQRVRLFIDRASAVEANAFFLDEAGTLDLSVIRNGTGKVTGIESISGQQAEEYRSEFFAGDIYYDEYPEAVMQELTETVN